ncbi:hypothetical protein BDA99DRAFT_522998 [Phascolomyces articulosus]|uniref:CENP-T/Histone H4 histone fold domain-containing protein n=1 Tax=Phascolomyces articulosus TaxID=60185 RepID=A0AAD5K0Y1_9FUNG|nr:hypothetical protein BDA99DRAFT_522998 [Phascolomyces articulosus]
MDLQFQSGNDSDDDHFDRLFSPTREFQHRTQATRVLQLLSNAPPMSIVSQSDNDNNSETPSQRYALQRQQQQQQQRYESLVHKREREQEFQHDYEQLLQKRPAPYPAVPAPDYSFRRRRRHQLIDNFNDSLTTISYHTDTNFTGFTNQRSLKDSDGSNLVMRTPSIADDSTSLEQRQLQRQQGRYATEEDEEENDLHWEPPHGEGLTSFTSANIAKIRKQQQQQQQQQLQFPMTMERDTQDDPFLSQFSTSQYLASQQEDVQELLQKKKDIQDMLDIKGKGRMMIPLPNEIEQEFAPISHEPELMDGAVLQPTPQRQQQQQHVSSLKQQEQEKELQQFMDQDYDDIEYDYGHEGGEYVDDHHSNVSKQQELQRQETRFASGSPSALVKNNRKEDESHRMDDDSDMDEFQENGRPRKNGNQIQRQEDIIRINPDRRYTSEKLQELRNPADPLVSFHQRYYSGASVTKANARQIFSQFSHLTCKNNIQARLQEVSELFFDQIANDLAAYARHADREVIKMEDMELLMRRQGVVDDNVSTEALAHRYLSREQWDEICTSARAFNTIYPNQ